MIKLHRMVALFLSLMMLLAVLPASAADSWSCPACGKINEGKFCPNDGQPRPTPTPVPDDGSWYCPECGTRCTGKFCPNDGHAKPVTDSPVEPTPAPTAVPTPAPTLVPKETPAPVPTAAVPTEQTSAPTVLQPRFSPRANAGKLPLNTPAAQPTEQVAPVPTSTPNPDVYIDPPEPDRVFEISDHLLIEHGPHTIMWTDSMDAAPYWVAYELVNDSNAVQSSFWAGDDEDSSMTYGNSFTCGDLIPGETYIIKIWDKDDTFFSKTITVPEAESFVDGKLKASSLKINIEYSYLKDADTAYSDAKPMNSLNGSDMAIGINNGRMYGLRYTINLPQLAYSRTYHTKMAFYAPNGYVYCTDEGSIEYDSFNSAASSSRWWYCLGDYFFANLYRKNEVIPSGTYTVKLFLNGMLANTSTFTVD